MPELSSTQALAAAWATLLEYGSLQEAIDSMGFLQADPIRSPARAQDLTLMQRLPSYKAGDLERLYPELAVEEDLIPNYGFVSMEAQKLLHPRKVTSTRIEEEHLGILEEVLELLHANEEIHPREAELTLRKGKMGNAWGGKSNATTRALDTLHYQGKARVVRRIKGVRVYGLAHNVAAINRSPLPEEERIRGVISLLANLYSPLPVASLRYLLGLSGLGLPGMSKEIKTIFTEMLGAELKTATCEGVPYVLNAKINPKDYPAPLGLRIVAPFDPLIWDRKRFEQLHGWAYKLEAYTPPAKRTLGYYAMPILWNGRAIGWANMQVKKNQLINEVNLIPSVRETKKIKQGIESETARYIEFLACVGRINID